ncbi:MAG: DUF5814 domain-containing protein [Methanoregulaceae archaeon]|nr:DUF5814 domain-containing protein [Methanoregulaceae archaeon]
MISGRARFRAVRKIERVIGYRLPLSAFHAITLEALSSHLDINRLDPVLRDQVLAFIETFLTCKCKTGPLCGCPERCFAALIIELRENGLDHRQISRHLLDEYGIEMYPADILSYLEDSVHVLEAVRDIAGLQENASLTASADQHILLLER